MLRSSLGENVDSEVGGVDLVVVLLLVFWSHGIALPLKASVCLLQVLLFLDQSILNDLGTSKESFFKVFKCFILNMDCNFFIKLYISLIFKT